MTLTTTLDRQTFPGDGSNKNFPFNFKFFDNSQIYVYLISPDGVAIGKSLNIDYTLSGALSPGGGLVVMTVAPPLNYQLFIRRILSPTQPTSIRNQGAFFPAIHEDVFDRLTMLLQQSKSESERSLKVQEYDPIPGLLPSVQQRSGKLLSFDGDGNPVSVAPESGSATALSIALADMVSLGLGSALVGWRPGITGGTGRTVDAKLRESISLKDFGAVGDGVADDTAAFNLAVAYANARGGDDYANIVGTTIFIPDGRYKITAAVTPVTRSGVEFVGASRQGTVILMPVGVYGVFTFGSGGAGPTPVGGGFSNAKFEYLTVPTASSCMFVVDHAFRLQFTNHLWVNIGQAFKLGTSTSRISGGVTLDNITGSCANIASTPVFQLLAGTGLLMTNVALFAGVPTPVHPAAMTTAANRNVFNCLGGFWDTVLASNCIFERFDYGMVVQAAATQVYQNLYFSNCIFDYHKTTVVLLAAAGGVVSTVMMSNCWYVSWEGPAIALSGGSYNDNHKFEGKVVIAGQEAIYYAVAGPKNNRFNLEIGAVNRVTTTSNSAMWFAPTATGFLVNGCSGNDDTSASGTPWRAGYGVTVGADADNYLVCNNRVTGTTGGYNIAANSASSVNRMISGNAEANYSGSVPMTLGGTGVQVFNKTPFVLNVHLYGGTVGGISANGVSIPNMTNGVITLDPGQYLLPTYSAAPALTAIARA